MTDGSLARAAAAAVLVLAWLGGCGAGTPSEVSSSELSSGQVSSGEVSSGEARADEQGHADRVGEARADEPAEGPRDEEVVLAPDIDPSLACSGPGECTRAYRERAPRAESDCACRTCASHVVNVAGLRAIGEADQRVCGAWYRSHDCPPVSCAVDTTRALCVRGMCIAEPVVSAQASPCRSPADCPREAACVTSALGGEIGCTDESCCGTAECQNGCVDDADCPACRPSCVAGACRDPHGAM